MLEVSFRFGVAIGSLHFVFGKTRLADQGAGDEIIGGFGPRRFGVLGDFGKMLFGRVIFECVKLCGRSLIGTVLFQPIGGSDGWVVRCLFAARTILKDLVLSLDPILDALVVRPVCRRAVRERFGRCFKGILGAVREKIIAAVGSFGIDRGNRLFLADDLFSMLDPCLYGFVDAVVVLILIIDLRLPDRDYRLLFGRAHAAARNITVGCVED